MKRVFIIFLVIFYSAVALSFDASFYPEKRARNASEIRVRFSKPVAPIGDPSFAFNPIEKVSCVDKKLEGIWEDPSTYVVKFDKPLPGGILCEVLLRENIKSVNGNIYSGKRAFHFDTDSVLVTEVLPYPYNRIRNDEIFLFRFNGEVDIRKNLKNIYFVRKNVLEATEVTLLPDKDVEVLLKEVYSYISTGNKKYYGIRAKSRFSDGEDVTLVFDHIESLSGLKGDYIQSFKFTVMEGFNASINCERESEKSDCIPISQLNVLFNSPVDVSYIKQIYLQDDLGNNILPDKVPEYEDAVSSISFSPPFLPLKNYKLFLPRDIKDVYGRELVNADKFPLDVKMDRMPPLAKFAADFGIVEMIDGEGIIPVTIRGLEKDFSLKISGFTQDVVYAAPTKKNIFERIWGFIKSFWGFIKSLFVSKKDVKKENPYIVPDVRLRQYNMSEIGVNKFLEMMSSTSGCYRENFKCSLLKDLKLEYEENRLSDKLDFTQTTTIGIPVKKYGLYFLEIESSYLNYLASEKDDVQSKQHSQDNNKTFISTIALVTDMAVTFKRGVHKSLVFVNRLRDAKPVEGADVFVYDCKGKEYFSSKTNKDGVAVIPSGLPDDMSLPRCNNNSHLFSSGYIVVAKYNGDMSFVSDRWNKGLEPYRFNIYSSFYSKKRYAIHSVLSRNLLRPQETIHIKSFARWRDYLDIKFAPSIDVLPKKMKIVHTGTDKSWDFDLKWDDLHSSLVVWQIPKDAPTGYYSIHFTGFPQTDHIDPSDYYHSAGFQVEEFKVPLIKGEIIAKQNRDKKSEIIVEGIFNYLMGSPANDMPITLRYRIKNTYYITDERYKNYMFSRGAVKAGITLPARRSFDEEFIGEGEYPGEESDLSKPKSANLPEVINLTTDEFGRFKKIIDIKKKYDRPVEMEIEAGYTDPSGYFYTISKSLLIYNSEYIIGTSLKYNEDKKALDIKAVLLNIDKKPVSKRTISINLYKNLNYTHRKKIVGGYYSYEYIRETKLIQEICKGETDINGEINCIYNLSSGGDYVVEAVTQDTSGEQIFTYSNYYNYRDVDDDMWFEYGSDSDRIDILPDKKEYRPGENITLRVVTPFKRSTALVTIEQDSVIDYFVTELDAQSPIIKIPVKKDYAPNVIISVVLARGRLDSPPPGFYVDLAKPSFKMGLVEVNVSKEKYRLNIKITTDKDKYIVGETVKGSVEVVDSINQKTDIMLIVVDEGLLELQENPTYNILDGIVGKAGYSVDTSSGMIQVVGRRHFGKKALPQGGGGGRISTRELFDTLLYFNPSLNIKNRKAQFEFKLNDSITSFRIVAIGVSGHNKFGTATKRIESYRELFINSGIPYFARERDVYNARFTIKNAGDNSHNLRVGGSITFFLRDAEVMEKRLDIKQVSIEKGGNKEIEYVVEIPENVDKAKYHLEIYEDSKLVDSIVVSQEIVESLPFKVTQSLFFRLKDRFESQYRHSDKDFLGKKISISIMKDLSGVGALLKKYRGYGLSCLEQKISYAVATNDMEFFQKLMSEINLYMDDKGFLKYYPTSFEGSPFLTAYILDITRLNGFELPQYIIERTTKALKMFIMGKAYFRDRFTTTSYNIERIYALYSISPYIDNESELFDALQIDTSLLPLSSLVDIENITPKRPEVMTAIKSHFVERGGAYILQSKNSNNLWWIMRSEDEAFARSLIMFLNKNEPDKLIGKMVMGLLNRFEGAYLTNTVANAYAAVALRMFAKRYSDEIKRGNLKVVYHCNAYNQEIDSNFNSADFSFYIDPSFKITGGEVLPNCSTDNVERLLIEDRGNQYWVKVLSEERGGIKGPIYNGFKIKKEYLDERGEAKTQFNLNDLLIVRITVEPDSRYNNIVIVDPLITGASVAGRMTQQSNEYLDYFWDYSYSDVKNGYIRTYYEYVYGSKIVFEYKVRLNVKGKFYLPTTRVELMYMPDIYGEIPNEAIEVK